MNIYQRIVPVSVFFILKNTKVPHHLYHFKNIFSLYRITASSQWNSPIPQTKLFYNTAWKSSRDTNSVTWRGEGGLCVREVIQTMQTLIPRNTTEYPISMSLYNSEICLNRAISTSLLFFLCTWSEHKLYI